MNQKISDEGRVWKVETFCEPCAA